jgi:endonuclease G, mitochondrial
MATHRTRAKPHRATPTKPARPKAPCHCGDEGFDARVAYQALSRDLARVIDLLAAGPEAASLATPIPRVEMTRSMAMLAAPPSARARSPFEAALRIVGGAPTGDFGACCCLGNADGWSCSGVLIREDVVLTAAHCGPYLTRVLVGGTSVDRLEEGEVVGVSKVMRHAAFDIETYQHDISLIRLAAPVKRVAPLELAATADLAQASELVLVGFGYNDPNRAIGFGTKRKVAVEMTALRTAPGQDLSREQAQYAFFPDTELVAGRKQLGRDACNGDSGGPALVATGGGGYRVGGITSRATRDANARCGDGGIYVRTDVYADWIHATLGG